MTWIRCDERLPEIDVEVLTYWAGLFHVGKRREEYGWVECTEYLSIVPTHWQPLPDPPSAECEPKEKP
jgi:hypothetical protein